MTILVTLWVATALLYPVLRSATTWFVDAVVLHRPDYRSLRTTIAHAAQDTDDVETLLSSVCELLTPALNAAFVTWRQWTSSTRDTLGVTVIVGAEAIDVADSLGGVRLSAPPATCVTIPTTISLGSSSRSAN